MALLTSYKKRLFDIEEKCLSGILDSDGAYVYYGALLNDVESLMRDLTEEQKSSDYAFALFDLRVKIKDARMEIEEEKNPGKAYNEWLAATADDDDELDGEHQGFEFGPEVYEDYDFQDTSIEDEPMVQGTNLETDSNVFKNQDQPKYFVDFREPNVIRKDKKKLMKEKFPKV